MQRPPDLPRGAFTIERFGEGERIGIGRDDGV